MRKDNWIARELRGISRNARDSWKAQKTLNCADCAGFAQSRNSRMSDIYKLSTYDLLTRVLHNISIYSIAIFHDILRINFH